MPVVSESLTAPAGGTPAGLKVTVFLVGEGGRGVKGFVASTNTIVATKEPTLVDGEWSETFVPNDDITPSGTAYKRVVSGAGRSESDIFVVPDGAGPYSLFELLTDPPGAIEPAPLSAEVVTRSQTDAALFAAVGVVDDRVDTVIRERPWSVSPYQYGGIGDRTTDDTQAILDAWDAAMTRDLPLDLRYGNWLIEDPSFTGLIPTRNRWRILGLGPDLTVVTNTTDAYLVVADTIVPRNIEVAGFTLLGGKGLLNVSSQKSGTIGARIFRDLELVDYTECAVQVNSEDCPRWLFDTVHFEALTDDGTMAFAHAGPANESRFINCLFKHNQYNLKLCRTQDVTIVNCDFHFSDDTPSAGLRASLWVVPWPGQGSEHDAFWCQAKFGNENQHSSDYRVLIAGEAVGVGTDVATRLADTTRIFANARHSIELDATGGTYTLTYSGQTTAAIAWNANAATIQAALEALSNIAPGDVFVFGNAADERFKIDFLGTLAATNVDLIVADPTNLTGGAVDVADRAEVVLIYRGRTDHLGEVDGMTFAGCKIASNGGTIEPFIHTFTPRVRQLSIIAGAINGQAPPYLLYLNPAVTPSTDARSLGNRVAMTSKNGAVPPLSNVTGFLQVADSYRVAKTATTDRATTTVVAADPHLSLYLPAGSYSYDGLLVATEGAADTNLKIDFDVPADATDVQFTINGQGVGASTDSGNSKQDVLGRRVTTLRGLLTVPLGFRVSGSFTLPTAGEVVPRWSQNTSNPAATSVLKGSWVEARPVNL